MPLKIIIPRLGWSMEEGIFGEWLKASGEFVKAGEAIFLLEGEKAAQEIESVDSGQLCIPDDAPQAGASVKVGEVIGFLLLAGETAPNSVLALNDPVLTAQSPPTSSQAKSLPQAVALARSASMHSDLIANTNSAIEPSATASTAGLPRVAGPAARRLARELGIEISTVSTPDPTGRVLRGDVERSVAQRKLESRSGRSSQSGTDLGTLVATPRARRKAKELGVDWTEVEGTGRNHRIRERDVIAYRSNFRKQNFQPSDEVPPIEPGQYQPASKLRLAIAQRLSVVMNQAVPVTLFTKVDAGALVEFRERQKEESLNGLIPSYHDILTHLTAQTLSEFPGLNACWYRNGIHTFENINVAIAVDTPNGLLTPVVRNADRLSLEVIAESSRQLITSAQSGKLNQNQLLGATFTITNLGMFGIDAFTPILNLPQAGILGVGRIVDEPVVRNGVLAAGKGLTLSLTFDHRVLDGAPAARWLQRLSDKIATLSVA